MTEIKTESEEHILPDSSTRMKNKDNDRIMEPENLSDNFKVEITIDDHTLNPFSPEANDVKIDPLSITPNIRVTNGEDVTSVQCMFCMKYLASTEKLHEHVNVYHPHENVDIQNTDSQILECKYCFKECANLGGLKNHIRMLHKDEKEVIDPEPKEKPKCDICNRAFKRKYELLRHKNSVHKDKIFTFTCKFCKCGFCTSGNLAEHIEKHHSKVSQECVSADKSSKSNYINHPLKRFECRYCFKECANSCGLKNHLRRLHSNEKDILELKPKEKPKCDICKRSYIRIYELTRHMKTQHDSNPLKCAICKDVFFSKYNLADHIEKYHRQSDNAEEKIDSINVESNDSIHETEEDESNGVEENREEGQTESTNNIVVEVTNVTDDQTFKCKYCSRVCANICGLKNHLRTIHKSVKDLDIRERHICNICGRSFMYNHELTRHMLIHNKGKFLRCEFCPTKFLTDKNLANHIEKVHGTVVRNSNFARCKICGVAYIDNRTLEDHLQKKPFSCSICCKHFCSELTLISHNKKNHEDPKFKCKMCDKSYLKVEALKDHVQNEHLTSPANKPQNLGYDSGVEPPPKLLKTDLSKNVDSKERNGHEKKNLETVEIKSKGKFNSLECDICLEKFSAWEDLEKHTLTSSKYACKICHKHFQRTLSLFEHMNTHSKEKIFQCEYCTRPYLMKGSLRTHIRMHHPTKVKIQDSRIKLYYCDDSTCDQKFVLYRDLVIHMRKHKGNKPYKCDLCQRQFSVSAHLDVHKKRRHEDIKPYNCDICQKPFYRKKFMLKHFNKHTLSK